MTDSPSKPGLQSQRSKTTERKPYAAPRITSRETLESAANVCTGFGAKAQQGAPSPGGGSCGQTQIGS